MIAVVDSGLANLASVMAALKRLEVEAIVTADAREIAAADRVILPGVGAAGAAMANLKDKGLDELLPRLTQPVLGICLGMQLLFSSSAEGETAVPCLGIIPGEIRKLHVAPTEPIPHMGWNQIKRAAGDHPLLRDVEDGAYVYFVHSYAASVGQGTIATATYGETFTAMVGVRNFFGCQFHPERSGAVGQQILKNFLEI